MASFLTAAQKAEYEAVMQNMHDTFARSIFAYKESQKVIVSTDPNFNYLYNNVKGVSQIVRKSQFSALMARILYMDKQTEVNFDSEVNSTIKVSHDIGEVRIKLDSDGYEYFKDAKRVEIDGRLMFKVTDVRKHGLFRPKFFTYYLRPTD
tara:strand:- start:2044 stop:2493 length:450 start_codon:yes stop_codon:yes gene_type:complete